MWETLDLSFIKQICPNIHSSIYPLFIFLQILGSRYRQEEPNLYDKVLARKLADAIEMWHEFHSSLTHLAYEKNENGVRKMSVDNLQNGTMDKLTIEEDKSWKNCSQITLASSDDELEEVREEDSDGELSNDETSSSSCSINEREKERGKLNFFRFS